MPIVVSFTRYLGRPGQIRQRYGPYRAAEVVGDALHVFGGPAPFVLAVRDAEGLWEVNGLPGLAFSHIRFVPPADEEVEDLKLLGADAA